MIYNDEYFNWLIIDASIDVFHRELLPILGRDKNDWILDRLELLLYESARALKSLREETLEKELDIEIKAIEAKIEIFKRTKEEWRIKELNDASMEVNPGHVKLLFAKNALGNNIFDGHYLDIKKDNDDKSVELVELLKKLDCGETTFNSEKQKILTNNRNLKGIFELKGSSIRLIYMREKDYTIVIGACVKKTDNDSKYQDALLNMRIKSEPYRKSVRNNSIDIEEELKTSREYFDRLVKSIERGK